MTISSRFNFGRPAPPVRGSAAGGKFWFCLTTAIADPVRLWGTAAGAQCLHLSERFFISVVIVVVGVRSSAAAERCSAVRQQVGVSTSLRPQRADTILYTGCQVRQINSEILAGIS